MDGQTDGHRERDRYTLSIVGSLGTKYHLLTKKGPLRLTLNPNRLDGDKVKIQKVVFKFYFKL